MFQQKLHSWQPEIRELRYLMEERRLPSNSSFVNLRASVDICTAFQEQRRCLDVAIFRGDMEQGATAKGQAPTS